MLQLCTYDDQGPVSLPDIHIFQVGVNPHTLHTKIFIKEIQSKIPKKHKFCCRTGVILLIPGLSVGVNSHTLHTEIFIKEIRGKILKKHKLSCTSNTHACVLG